MKFTITVDLHHTKWMSVKKWRRKRFLKMFLTSDEVFNNNVISNGKPYCRYDTFTDIRFTSLQAKNV